MYHRVELLARYSNSGHRVDLLCQLAHIEPSHSLSLSPAPKQPQRRLGPEEVDELVAAYRSGATLREVASQFEVHRTTASKHLERRSVRRRRRSLEPVERAEAIRLYEAGLSVAEVGKRLGFDGGTIWLALRQAGVRLRDTQGRQRLD